jgi:inositol phosphorylceramide mannosyltransferase catalytic subunit
MIIPYRFFRIWVGEHKMPEEFVRWWETWKQHHPGAEFLTLRDFHLKQLLEEPGAKHFAPWAGDLAAKAANRSQLSNLYRYLRLFFHGGIYVDTDFECLKDIRPLLGGADVVIGEKKDALRHESFCPAFMACVPGNPLLRALVDGIPKEDVTVSLSLGSVYLTKVVDAYPGTVKILPYRTIYPYTGREMHLGLYPRRAWEFPDAYALHHWSSKWYKPGFESLHHDHQE